MALLKRQNESMEAELKEMQERYSEISLKFAEVEGERQQLVMTIRTLKNALKNQCFFNVKQKMSRLYRQATGCTRDPGLASPEAMPDVKQCVH